MLQAPLNTLESYKQEREKGEMHITEKAPSHLITFDAVSAVIYSCNSEQLNPNWFVARSLNLDRRG